MRDFGFFVKNNKNNYSITMIFWTKKYLVQNVSNNMSYHLFEAFLRPRPVDHPV